MARGPQHLRVDFGSCDRLEPHRSRLYRAAQQALRAMGLNAWVFETVSEAMEWLEGRPRSGRTAS
jgi:hypothetical protein